jgi:hypothetical protein
MVTRTIGVIRLAKDEVLRVNVDEREEMRVLVIEQFNPDTAEAEDIDRYVWIPESAFSDFFKLLNKAGHEISDKQEAS